MENVRAKKHEETKQACISFKSIAFVKKYILQGTKLTKLTRKKEKNHAVRPLSYRNQPIDLLRKSMDWFLYDNGLQLFEIKSRSSRQR